MFPPVTTRLGRCNSSRVNKNGPMVGIISKFTSDSSDPLLHVGSITQSCWNGRGFWTKPSWLWEGTHNLRCIISLVFGVAFSLLLGGAVPVISWSVVILNGGLSQLKGVVTIIVVCTRWYLLISPNCTPQQRRQPNRTTPLLVAGRPYFSSSRREGIVKGLQSAPGSGPTSILANWDRFPQLKPWVFVSNC